MDLQEQFDDLDNIVITLTMLMRETKDKYFIDMLSDLKFEAQNQRDEIQERLWKHKEEI